MKPFDELDQAGLRFLGFSIAVTREGELAVLTGETKIELSRSGEDRLALVITAPNGREFAAMIPRDILQEAADEARDETIAP